MGQKTFIKAKYLNNIHTCERFLATATFESLCVVTFQTE